MKTLSDTKLLLEKIDRNILRLLFDRIQICSDACEIDGVTALREAEQDTILLWAEEATDHGMDEVQIEKIAQNVIELCKTESD